MIKKRLSDDGLFFMERKVKSMNIVSKYRVGVVFNYLFAFIKCNIFVLVVGLAFSAWLSHFTFSSMSEIEFALYNEEINLEMINVSVLCQSMLSLFVISICFISNIVINQFYFSTKICTLIFQFAFHFYLINRLNDNGVVKVMFYEINAFLIIGILLYFLKVIILMIKWIKESIKERKCKHEED